MQTIVLIRYSPRGKSGLQNSSKRFTSCLITGVYHLYPIRGRAISTSGRKKSDVSYPWRYLISEVIELLSDLSYRGQIVHIEKSG